MSLRVLFPGARFSPPARADQIDAVEATLGVVLPEQLRNLYLECDGFREPKGNAKYLLSLTNEDFIGSLVSTTKFWWEEWPRITRPGYPMDFSPFVCFGSSSGDAVWCIRWQGPSEIVAYHHSMEDEYEPVGVDILDVYRRDYSSYE